MGRFFDALKAGVKGFKEGFEPVSIRSPGGRSDVCTVVRRSLRRVAHS
jgi:hypothetical protein